MVASAGAMVRSEMVPGVDGVSEREGSGRRRLMFLSSREASAAASFLARADSESDMSSANHPYGSPTVETVCGSPHTFAPVRSEIAGMEAL